MCYNGELLYHCWLFTYFSMNLPTNTVFFHSRRHLHTRAALLNQFHKVSLSRKKNWWPHCSLMVQTLQFPFQLSMPRRLLGSIKTFFKDVSSLQVVRMSGGWGCVFMCIFLFFVKVLSCMKMALINNLGVPIEKLARTSVY